MRDFQEENYERLKKEYYSIFKKWRQNTRANCWSGSFYCTYDG